jgi:hypothetical protein
MNNKAKQILTGLIFVWVLITITFINFDKPKKKKDWGSNNCIDLDAIDRNNQRIEAIMQKLTNE